MVTKFSEKFAIIMLKKHRKFCRCGLTHLDATPTFKNRPNTYDAHCRYIVVRLYLKLNRSPKGCVALLLLLLCHNFASYYKAILIRNSVNVSKNWDQG